MYRGTLSYILFCLDAYSQYIYAIPLKDKTSVSVLQGFLSLFSTTGWPEAVYLDNETSFQKTAKLLIKVAPIKVHYSTPYCQFQNFSENYIKNFKKTFLKILNDSENPQANSDWPLLLPTVTQALNRQIIPAVGMSREAIHFNCVSEFLPLAHLTSEANSEFNDSVNTHTTQVFQSLLKNRRKERAYSRKAKVPQFHETQVVFMKDQSPSVSTILKIPNRGPFRIEKLEERNVTLTEIETGRTVHSHVQNIRPLNLSEFRLLLNQKWDLNAHNLKATEPIQKPGIFDAPAHPMTAEEVIASEKSQDEIEKLQQSDETGKTLQSLPNEVLDEIGLENLFYPEKIDLLSQPKPPDRSQSQEGMAEGEILQLHPPVQPRRSPRLQARSQTASSLTELTPTLSNTEPESQNTGSLSDEILSENDAEDSSHEAEENLSFNSLDVYQDLSKDYKSNLRSRKSRTVSFYLTKQV
jgi:hypothetical protein